MDAPLLLSESEKVFLAAGIGRWHWDAESGTFTFSEEAEIMLQVRDDEQPLQLESVLETLHDEDLAAFQAAMMRMAEEPGTRSVEFRATLDDGELRWYRAVGQAEFKGDEVTHAAGVIIDTTAQHRAEQARGAFFEQPNGIHLVAGLDGEIGLVNIGWQLALGYRTDELIGENFLDYVHPDDREATLAEVDNLERGIRTHYFENRYRHRNGSYRLIAWSAAVPESHRYIYAIGKDITEERAAQDRLTEAAVVFNNSGEGILMADEDGIIRNVNEAFTEITGYSRDEAIGQHTRLLRSGRHDAAFYRKMWDDIANEGLWRGEIWNRRKSGETFPELLTITRVAGGPGGYVAIFTDISKLKNTEEQLQRLAHYDQLTHLPNRYLINERLIQSLRRAHRRELRVAVIFLDIDSFKNINDSLGHFAGDRLLTMTARRLKNALRDDDNIGRIGGDEFLIVLEDINSLDDVTTIAEKVIGALRAPMEINGREISVSASLGISLYPSDGQTAEVLMSNADAAMYSAKEQGRDTFRFYSERLTRRAFQHVLLDTALREAVARDELRLAFQPQLNVGEHRLLGLEVLLRWHHPQLGTVSPTEFIPHAERTGLIRGIGRWVLRSACVQGARWAAQGLEFGRLAVNISAPQFRDEHFAKLVRETLEETGFPASRLELEITESVLVQDTEELIERMHELRELGVRFAIDDFGTGYSSLAYLKRMPIDRLKLDKSFVRDLCDDENDRIIAQAVIALGEAMGIAVIAEGIETLEQQLLLRELGCVEMQGFLFSMPQYANRIEALLADHDKLLGR